MTDLTATAALSGIIGLQYDNSNGLLYALTNTGGFSVWNPQTGSFTNSVSLGGTATGFDITPDGQYALVARSDSGGAFPHEIERINLSNLSVTELNLSGPPLSVSASAYNLATTAAGITLAGFFGLTSNEYQFQTNASTLSLTAISSAQDSWYGGAIFTSSAEKRYVLISGSVSNGSLEIYDSQAN